MAHMAHMAHMGYTQEQAAADLGMSRSALARMLAGGPIDRRTALACAALAHGLVAWSSESGSTAASH